MIRIHSKNDPFKTQKHPHNTTLTPAQEIAHTHPTTRTPNYVNEIIFKNRHHINHII
jgi:hypothetical protein